MVKVGRDLWRSSRALLCTMPLSYKQLDSPHSCWQRKLCTIHLLCTLAWSYRHLRVPSAVDKGSSTPLTFVCVKQLKINFMIHEPIGWCVLPFLGNLLGLCLHIRIAQTSTSQETGLKNTQSILSILSKFSLCRQGYVNQMCALKERAGPSAV